MNLGKRNTSITRGGILLLSLLCFVYPSSGAELPASAPGAKLVLTDGWFIQPSPEVPEKPSVLSTAGFQPKHWYHATMPSTVVAALAADRVYADPYFGMNLRSIPGTSYTIGTTFSGIPMPPGSPFRSSWWYQTQFTAPAGYRGKRVQLHFDGLNFRANVWLNGRQIADANTMAGTWRLFEFDVTDLVAPGSVNALAVEVFPQTPEDLGLSWVDWNPTPPDKNMGIWRPVYLTASGAVTIRFPQVITKLNLPAVDKARLTVTAEVRNTTSHGVKGVLKGQIEGIQFSQPVTLDSQQTRVVTFSPDQFAELNLANPRLWWPVQVGPQNLYELKLQFQSAGSNSDEVDTHFGIREISSEVEKPAHPELVFSGHDEGYTETHRVFSINGKRILIRGAGYTPDMLLRESPVREEEELKYVRDMNLNAVRLEGKIVSDHFLDLADQYGILIMAGWTCCSHWEQWEKWDAEDHVISAESLKDQIRRLRSHPAVFNWMNGSDGPPPADVEQRYIDILKELNWPNPYESSAMAKPTTVTGDTGVKMTGPYQYVGPSYWLLDTKYGGAHGFNTETSPGPSPLPVESLVRTLPQDHLWPIDSWWDYHAGGSAFRNLNVFTEAMNNRYGEAANLQDYSMKAQVMAYEGERAMFEAFGRNKYTSTGVIQWMLNNAWPSTIWHLYDYYLRPGGSYFGAKKGCEPLHIQYSYDDHSIAVVNSYYTDFKALKATAKVYNLDLTEKFARETTLDIPSDGVQKIFILPAIDGLTSTYFVDLTLRDSDGKVVSSNFYWLSTKPEVLDWDKSTWYTTPTKSFDDLTALNTLPKVRLNVSSESEIDGDYGTTRVTVENLGKTLAFAVHLKVMKPSRFVDPESENNELEVLPVIWQDNYFPLLPGEKREITATYRKADLELESRSSDTPNWAGKQGKPTVDVDGWNVLPGSTAAAQQ
jgi:exo-1,4-beta-D-glucosaminidase